MFMKYIVNKFDDELSRVTRDMIVAYPLFKSKRRKTDIGMFGDDSKRDLVQVYPWEDISKLVETHVKYYKIRDKWFVTKEVWDEVAANRPSNFSALVSHVFHDPRVHIHRLGLFKFIVGSIQAWRIKRALEKKGN